MVGQLVFRVRPMAKQSRALADCTEYGAAVDLALRNYFRVKVGAGRTTKFGGGITRKCVGHGLFMPLASPPV